jgi:hypothetical protein
MSSVFVSYAHHDKVFVRELIGDLRAVGLPATYDEWILDIGDSIIEKISEAVTDADAVIPVLSTNSVTSKWVSKELSLAMTREVNGKQVRVLPIMLEDCTLPPLLSDKLYADFRFDYAEGLGRLVRSLKRNLAPHEEFLLDELQRSVRAYTKLIQCLAEGDARGAAIAACVDYPRKFPLFFAESAEPASVATPNPIVSSFWLRHSDSSGKYCRPIEFGLPSLDSISPDSLGELAVARINYFKALGKRERRRLNTAPFYTLVVGRRQEYLDEARGFGALRERLSQARSKFNCELMSWDRLAERMRRPHEYDA